MPTAGYIPSTSICKDMFKYDAVRRYVLQKKYMYTIAEPEHVIVAGY